MRKIFLFTFLLSLIFLVYFISKLSSGGLEKNALHRSIALAFFALSLVSGLSNIGKFASKFNSVVGLANLGLLILYLMNYTYGPIILPIVGTFILLAISYQFYAISNKMEANKAFSTLVLVLNCAISILPALHISINIWIFSSVLLINFLFLLYSILKTNQKNVAN